MDLLRFVTAGSVDDGKSTLIGRLLYDSKSIYEDLLEDLKKSSKRMGSDEINLALLTDGLRSEREQGITIDVAYRFFSTPRRKFIIIDSPGHVQYTRNMASGASHAEVALLLIDVTKGLREQTKRHSLISSLLGINHLVICVNKMDLVDYNQANFEKIHREFDDFAEQLQVENITYIPISAKLGDNVTLKSENMPWYQGKDLLDFLETVTINRTKKKAFRLPIQGVIRAKDEAQQEQRFYTGNILSGQIQLNEEVCILPHKIKTKIKSISEFSGHRSAAGQGMAVRIELQDEVDVSRGDMIVSVENAPRVSQQFEAMVCWFNENPLVKGARFHFRQTTHSTPCVVEEIQYKIDQESLTHLGEPLSLEKNDIARIRLRTSKNIFFDSYKSDRLTGSAILIDEVTHETVAAVMII